MSFKQVKNFLKNHFNPWDEIHFIDECLRNVAITKFRQGEIKKAFEIAVLITDLEIKEPTFYAFVLLAKSQENAESLVETLLEVTTENDYDERKFLFEELFLQYPQRGIEEAIELMKENVKFKDHHQDILNLFALGFALIEDYTNAFSVAYLQEGTEARRETCNQVIDLAIYYGELKDVAIQVETLSCENAKSYVKQILPKEEDPEILDQEFVEVRAELNSSKRKRILITRSQEEKRILNIYYKEILDSNPSDVAAQIIVSLDEKNPEKALGLLNNIFELPDEFFEGVVGYCVEALLSESELSDKYLSILEKLGQLCHD